MSIKNLQKRYFVIIVSIFALVLIPGTQLASHTIVLPIAKDYGEELYNWCGPAVAQIIMRNYPTAPLLKAQDEIWPVIQANKVETMWHSDPQGVKEAMNRLNPPPYPEGPLPLPQGYREGWHIYNVTNKNDLMYEIAFWITKKHYPVAVLLSTSPHNNMMGHEERWVIVYGIETDVDPTIQDNTSINLLKVHYIDPSPANLGTPLSALPPVSGQDWYNMLQPVSKSGSVYYNHFVAIIEKFTIIWPPID